MPGGLPQRWLILADDLTGAADSAIAFGRRGIASAVSWGPVADDRAVRSPVFSYDADSRGMTGEAAGRCHTRALAEHLGPDRGLFKKIDSTLRGQPAAETAATIAHLRSRGRSCLGVLAPAFPQLGRTTLDGRIQVSGRPLESTDTWRLEHTYANADLADALASAGVAAEKIGLGDIRGSAAGLATALNAVASRAAVAVCDAETDADLTRIVHASLSLDEAPFFIGSAGLAHALAASGAPAAAWSDDLAPTTRGTLIVVGSRAAVSRAGARQLIEQRAVFHAQVSPEALLAQNGGAREALGHEVASRLAVGEDVLVEIWQNGSADRFLGPGLLAGLADALRDAAPVMGAFAATGGETAAALLSHFGVNGIRLADEIEPGVPLGLTLGALSVPIATKAGAFGGEATLMRMAERLKTVRTKGSFA